MKNLRRTPTAGNVSTEYLVLLLGCLLAASVLASFLDNLGAHFKDRVALHLGGGTETSTRGGVCRKLEAPPELPTYGNGMLGSTRSDELTDSSGNGGSLDPDPSTGNLPCPTT